MSLYNREQGSLLSQIEWNLIFNDKYSDSGFVKYLTKNGKYFSLNPSPFLENKKTSIYYSGDYNPPPENTFIQTEVINEELYNQFRKNSIKTIKTIDKWNLFDPTPLAERRKIIDYEEIIHYFSIFLSGEEQYIEEIATCSSLYCFSSPPRNLYYGGLNAAIFGQVKHWHQFKSPLRIIPLEMKRNESDYYYYISEKEKSIDSIKSKERNFALLKPEKTISDIPIVMDDLKDYKIARDYRSTINESSGIIIAYMLDSLLLEPKPSKKVEDKIGESIYKLIEDYKKGGHVLYNQNLGDAIPKLSASYARLKHNSDIVGNDVDDVMNLWLDMHYRTTKLYRTPLKISQMYELTGDARRLYIDLNEIHGVDFNMPLKDALEISSLDYEDFINAIDSLCQRGYCIRNRDSIRLVDQY